MDIKKLQQSLIPFGIVIRIDDGSEDPDILAVRRFERSANPCRFTQDNYRDEEHLAKKILKTLSV